MLDKNVTLDTFHLTFHLIFAMLTSIISSLLFSNVKQEWNDERNTSIVLFFGIHWMPKKTMLVSLMESIVFCWKASTMYSAPCFLLFFYFLPLPVFCSLFSVWDKSWRISKETRNMIKRLQKKKARNREERIHWRLSSFYSHRPYVKRLLSNCFMYFLFSDIM